MKDHGVHIYCYARPLERNDADQGNGYWPRNFAIAMQGASRASSAPRASPFRYFKTSPEIIRLAVMLYIRFPLSLRNVEDLLLERSIEISHETVRFWWNRFGPELARCSLGDASTKIGTATRTPPPRG